jgi:hypothetical protein
MATIAENLQTIIDIKADIKTAIENKGVTVGDAGFSEYASKINEISVGTGDIVLDKNIKIAYSDGTSYWTWPSNIKFPAKNDWSNAFKMVKAVEGLPAITTKVDGYRSNFYHMFDGANIAYHTNTTFFNSIDYSNVEDMSYMFSARIQNFAEYSLIVDSPYLKNISHLFYSADEESRGIPAIIQINNCSQINNVAYAFSFDAVTDITTLRLLNIGQGFSGKSSLNSHKLDLQRVKFTTKQACLDLMNDLYDMNQTSVTDATIVLKQSHFDNLSDEEKAIVTNKGWILESA